MLAETMIAFTGRMLSALLALAGLTLGFAAGQGRMGDAPIPPPLRLAIPSIGVNAPVESIGLDPDGKMEVPSAWDSAGWYALGPTPGENGNAVIAGHLDSDTGPAIFWDVKKLKAGDDVTVLDRDGGVHRFAVETVETYDAKAPPMHTIFASGGIPRLVLITCGGEWKDGEYDKRVAVYAKKVD